MSNEKKVLSKDRIKTLETIKKLTSYDDGLNVYSMDIFFDYSIDKLTPCGVHDTQSLMGLALSEALPGIEVELEAPEYGCSAFLLRKNGAGYIMGRNYDFKYDTSCMILRCDPKDGYKSIAHAALDNIKVRDPFESETAKVSCLSLPFMCLDGINEKGLGAAVLTVDGEPVCQDTGKPVLATPVLIRLVLDRAGDVKEALRLLEGYDMFATSGRDYHFFLCDRSGESVAVEFDCESPERTMTVTPVRAMTNFYSMYSDKVICHQKNGNYGHGKERVLAIEDVIRRAGGSGGHDVSWEALKASSQEPDEEYITSNTQWSISYDLEELSYELVLHRRWDDVTGVDMINRREV